MNQIQGRSWLWRIIRPYDPNEFYNLKKYPIGNQRNRALTDVYEPGSTFKIVPVSGALNEGIVQVGQKFAMGLTSVQYQGHNIKMPRDSHIRDDKLDLHSYSGKIEQCRIGSGRDDAGVVIGSTSMLRPLVMVSLLLVVLEKSVSGILHPVSRWDRLTISRLPIGTRSGCDPVASAFCHVCDCERGCVDGTDVCPASF